MSNFIMDYTESESNANDPVFVSDLIHSDPVLCSKSELTNGAAEPNGADCVCANLLSNPNSGNAVEVVSLESLDVDQLCGLLVNGKLSALQTCVREQSLSGKILASYVTSVEDLTDVGMKVLHARALFDLIAEWKSQGLPQSFVLSLQHATPVKDRRENDTTEGSRQQVETTDKRKHEMETMEKKLQEITAEKLRLEHEAVQRLKDQARQLAWRTCMRCHSASHITEKYVSWAGYGGEPYRLWCTTCNQALDHRYSVQPSSDFMP